MANIGKNEEFEALCEQINELYEHQDSLEFTLALSKLNDFAELGSIDAAEYLAEILAHDGPNHDAASAYKWYFVALSSQEYLTEFNNISDIPHRYCGVIGDFRNESMVSDLVDELGLEHVRQLDSEIRQWLDQRSCRLN